MMVDGRGYIPIRCTPLVFLALLVATAAGQAIGEGTGVLRLPGLKRARPTSSGGTGQTSSDTSSGGIATRQSPTAPDAVKVEALLKIPMMSCAAKGANYFFNVAALACSVCPLGTVPNAERNDCICPTTSRIAGRTGPLSCVSCASQSFDVSSNGEVCMPCQAQAAIPSTPEPKQNSSATAPLVLQPVCSGNTIGAAAVSSTQSTQPAGAAQTQASVATKCTCPEGYAISDWNATGDFSGTGGKLCFLCPYSSYVAPSTPGMCTPCPDPLMMRDPASGKCRCGVGLVEDSIVIAGSTTSDIPIVGSHVCLDTGLVAGVGFAAIEYGAITFKNVIDVDGARTESIPVDKSEAFLRHFLEAAVRCKDSRRWQSCQTLANLCTLALHNKENPACKVLNSYVTKVSLNKIHNFEGWRAGYPWLNYESASRDVIFSTDINRQVALSGDLNMMNLTLSVYALNGTFLGFEDLSTQLHLCQGDDRRLRRFRRFGSNTLVKCSFDLTYLIYRNDEPRFYELWMDDAYDKSGKLRPEGIALYPLPVIIANYEEDKKLPNKILTDQKSLSLGEGSSGREALDKVKLHRRFFLWDNLSGQKIRDKTKQTEKDKTSSGPTIIRWAKYVELRVTLQTDDTETKNVDESIRMFPPHLIIEYDQQLVSTVPRVDLDVGEKLEEMRYPKVEFRSRYTMQLDYFWNVMLGVGIAWIILMVIWAGIKLSVRQQSQSMTWNGIAADIVGSTADWLFSGMFLVSAYWFCFFKLQSEVESLLPLENPHPSFLVCVVVAGWCKIIHVALLIFGQCNIDLFFIDFEPGSVKDKERRGAGHKGEDEEGGALPQVSVWRSIVIANEWNEMQTERHTDIDFTLIFLLFFLRGLDLINLDTPQPVEQDLSEDVPNIVLRFFVICSFYLLVVLAQGIYKMVDYRYAFDPLDTFCALCQHANISVFILDEALHGYYIHGKSVHPSTDVNMMQLQANLRDEANNKTQASGLSRKPPEILNGASDQVFEMYITETIREELNEERRLMDTRGVGTSKMGGTDDAHKIRCRAHHNINEHLKKLIYSDMESNAEIQAPGLAHLLFAIPPPKRTVPVLLRDDRKLFSTVCLYGIESHLILMDLLVFVMWDLVCQDVFIAALLTYIISHGLVRIRDRFGTQNVAAKTLIDERFLI